MLQFDKACKYVADFETTVYDGQEKTEVWAAASVKLWSEDVEVFNRIDSFFKWHFKKQKKQIIYFHNLKFDGAFIVDWLIKSGFLYASPQHRALKAGELRDPQEFTWIDKVKDMPVKSFKTVISDMGMWYLIVIKTYQGKIIEIRDSLKLLPFTVKKIGKDFGCKHQKLEIEYEGFREAGGVISESEKEYIKNDVLVVKEGLEALFNQGLTELTIGACCLKEFKGGLGFSDAYDCLFPDLTESPLDYNIYGQNTVDAYIRKSYRGGWCYVVKGKEDKIFKDGTTADVNSLYPSSMHSESGNIYPYDTPIFWEGSEIPDEALDGKHYYFIRIRTRFYLKKDKLPFIQIKDSWLYNSRDNLESSDVWDGKKYRKWLWDGGVKVPTSVTLTLTQTDYELIKEHYDLIDCEILDGCYFKAKAGFFDDYIDHWSEVKKTSKGARRQCAKLLLNNLYGKMSASTASNFQVPVNDNGVIKYFTVVANDKKAGYIPVGSAITSYSRAFTIRAAQKNYYGKNKRGFIYADTDSIHCDLKPDEIKGIKVHPTNFNCWKLESCWDKGIFVRPKTYIERVTKEDLQEVEPYLNIKCAGMPQRCKDLLNASITGCEIQAKTKDEEYFLKTKRQLTDFKRGLKVPSKLLPKRIEGGIVLLNTTYAMR